MERVRERDREKERERSRNQFSAQASLAKLACLCRSRGSHLRPAEMPGWRKKGSWTYRERKLQEPERLHPAAKTSAERRETHYTRFASGVHRSAALDPGVTAPGAAPVVVSLLDDPETELDPSWAPVHSPGGSEQHEVAAVVVQEEKEDSQEPKPGSIAKKESRRRKQSGCLCV